ncbi:hypothetical protein RB653_001109 [Dictyostelium firmibasis]|uniref:Myotubularin phosphatase domain-containing protein n=1 Tax=Dictyostelium firmibasis TaxID=79012 RepID=A0AAN7U4I1_9MYCE
MTIIQNEHPEINNIINNIQQNQKNNKINDLKNYLENSKHFSDFRKYLIEKNKYSLASMLQCYESIQSFKQSFLVDNPPFNLKLANDIISTFLIKPNVSPNTSNSNLFSNSSTGGTGSSPPQTQPLYPSSSFYIGFIDTSVYNSLKALLDPLWQKPTSLNNSSNTTTTTNNPLSTSSSSIGGSLFDSSPLDSDLFSTPTTTPMPTNKDQPNITTVEDPEEPTKEQLNKQKEIKDDLSAHVTHNLFDVLLEFLLFKLEPEFRKYIALITPNNEQNFNPLNSNSNNINNNNTTNLNANMVFESPLTPKKEEVAANFYINNLNNSSNSINYSRLEGENRIVWFGDQDHIPVYYVDHLNGAIIQALLYITEFRFLFISKQTLTELTWIPLATVYRIERVTSFRFDSAISIWGKNFRRIEFHIEPKEFKQQSFNTLGGVSVNNNNNSNSGSGNNGSPYINGGNNNPLINSGSNGEYVGDITQPIIYRMRIFAFQDVPNLFAFKYSPNKSQLQDGWRILNDFGEWLRQGILTETPGSYIKWRYSEKNIEYINPTYPKWLVVPHNISDEEVGICMNFRSKGRIPALSWISRDGVPLARSSQPMVGITRQKSLVDEKLVDSIRLACPSGKSLFLLDARPKANAIANVAKGMGYELNYNCDIEFLGIANIHSMRDSINKLEQFCQSNNDENWLSGLNETRWLDHIRTLLLGVARAVSLINKGHPVLLHCSDGWDRTSQLSSLTMIIQDPYFRTIEGFQVLIEKEWLSFGHCFMNRVRHGDRNWYSDSQRSPVFLQFIDCVYQLMNQYHDYFQFNENYLITILDALYSCQFGTFLCNSEKERQNLKKDTISLWSYINSNPLTPYLNPFYTSYEQETSRAFHLPEWRSEHITLWKGYYLRYWRNPLKEPMDWQKVSITLKLKNNHLLNQIQDLIVQNQQLTLDNLALQEEKHKEKENVENEKVENEKVENEKVENEKVENEKVENEKVENEKVEEEKVEKEKVEKEKVEEEKAEILEKEKSDDSKKLNQENDTSLNNETILNETKNVVENEINQ